MPLDATTPARGEGVLAGLLVVDFTQAIAGPFATRILAELGARVIKIESLRGDIVRAIQHREGAAWAPMFGHGSSGKESIAVDLRTEAGFEIVDRLIDEADVVVENFRPGSLERLGFDPNEIVTRPRSPVVCSVSGFGRGTSQSEWSATDPLGQAFSGMTYMIGDKGGQPYLAANGIADSATAMSAATAILAAIIGRQKNGKGRYIDLSMADVMLAMDCVTNPVAAAYEDVLFEPLGHDHPAVCPFGVFNASDGKVVIQGMGQGAGSTWGNLCKALGRQDLMDDPRTASAAARLDNRAIVNEAVQSAIAQMTQEQVVVTLQAAGCLIGPVLSPRQAVEHPYYAARGGIRATPTEEEGRTQNMVALPFHVAGLTGAPPRPSLLGEHTNAILSDLLGYSAERITRLRKEGVVTSMPSWP